MKKSTKAKKPKAPPIVEEQIGLFFHCRKCISELPAGLSPRDYGSVEVGWTKNGFQVWCKRHEINVIHISFRGQKVEVAG